MALAEEPVAPPDGGEHELPLRLQPLARFIDEHYLFRLDDPAASRLDAYDFVRTHRSWLRLNQLPDPPGQATTYSDLRYHFGLTVRRSSGNRYIIEGLQPRPGRHYDLERLLALADQPYRPLPQPELAAVSRDVRLQVQQQAQQELERLLGRTYKIADDLLDSPDQNVRKSMLSEIWARYIPKVAVRIPAEEAIDVKAADRPSLAEIEEVLRARFAERSGVGATSRDEGD
jgi:hypothetical protein